jgi:hypothetical protein
MIVWHVISIKKFMRCMNTGSLPSPVRGWETIEEAERFSKQTGRSMILRLKFPKSAEKWVGHKNLARVIYEPYPTSKIFNGFQL